MTARQVSPGQPATLKPRKGCSPDVQYPANLNGAPQAVKLALRTIRSKGPIPPDIVECITPPKSVDNRWVAVKLLGAAAEPMG